MGTDEARNYRESMRYMSNQMGAHDVQRREQKEPRETYYAPKGTTKRAMSSKKKRRVALRVGALILAAGIGIRGVGTAIESGISYVGSLKDGGEKQSITQLQEKGVDLSKLGLERDTIEEMEIYDGYFANTDFSDLNITDNDVLKILREINAINENVIKDKMANLEGVDRTSIDLGTNFDGKYYGRVSVKRGEVYSGASKMPLGIGERNVLSDEISDSIVQSMQEYSNLATDLREDRISKLNAVKELKKMYENVTQLATKQFVKDGKGNIEAIEYDENVKNMDDNVR